MKDLTIFDKNGKAITTILISDEDQNNISILDTFKEHLGGSSYKINEDGEYYLPESAESFFVNKPYDSWIWSVEDHMWKAPISYPDDNKNYEWNEQSQNWAEISSN